MEVTYEITSLDGKLPLTIGSLSLPTLNVTIRGDSEEVERIVAFLKKGWTLK